MLDHMADIEQTRSRADVFVARDLAYIGVGERHGPAAEGHHLCAMLDVEVVQARLLVL